MVLVLAGDFTISWAFGFGFGCGLVAGFAVKNDIIVPCLPLSRSFWKAASRSLSVSLSAVTVAIFGLIGASLRWWLTKWLAVMSPTLSWMSLPERRTPECSSKTSKPSSFATAYTVALFPQPWGPLRSTTFLFLVQRGRLREGC